MESPSSGDALAFIGAALGSGAVQLPFAGMGDDPWLRGVGGRADPGPARGLRDRCRLGPLHPVARDLTPPPGGPSAAAGVVELTLPARFWGAAAYSIARNDRGIRLDVIPIGVAARFVADSPLEGSGFEPSVPASARRLDICARSSHWSAHSAGLTHGYRAVSGIMVRPALAYPCSRTLETVGSRSIPWPVVPGASQR